MRHTESLSASPAVFTHVDARHAPTMVDVGGKAITRRTAVAKACVVFPEAAAEVLRSHGYNTAKGPVFHTAIIAGVLAAKRTHELIPFCHPLAIENCKIDIEMIGNVVHVSCAVSVEYKTGVEMEAITGAGIAAMTIYDMCKALTHELVISEIRLIEKRGGRSDINPRREESIP